LKRKAKEQAHEQLKEEEQLKLETKKTKLKKKEARDKFCKLQKQTEQSNLFVCLMCIHPRSNNIK